MQKPTSAFLPRRRGRKKGKEKKKANAPDNDAFPIFALEKKKKKKVKKVIASSCPIP
jgi:hypothetical protein